MSRAEAKAAAVIAAGTIVVLAAALPLVRRAAASRFEIEPSIAATPSGMLAVAFMEGSNGPADAIGVRTSQDLGATWIEAAHLRSPDGRFAADPALVAEGESFTLAWLGFRQNVARRGAPYDTRVVVARGLGPATEVTGGQGGEGYDRPAAAATKDALDVVFRFEAPSRRGIAIARSVRGGAFARAEIAGGGAFEGGLPAVCATADGARVYVTYVDPSAGVVARASDDAGATWPEARARVLAPADAALAFEGAPCVARGDDVWVAYGRAATAEDSAASAVLSSIVVAHSGDAGRSFDAEVAAREPGLLLMHPALAVDAAGAVVVAYYAGGAAGARFRTPRGDVRRGLRFVTRRAAPGWAGDFAGLVATDRGVFAALVDNAGLPRATVAEVP